MGTTECGSPGSESLEGTDYREQDLTLTAWKMDIWRLAAALHHK